MNVHGKDICLGKYRVHEDAPTADHCYRDITAYDAMYDIINADVAAWYNTILPNDDSTVTLRIFRKSFVEYFGLEEDPVDLVNDEMIIHKTIRITAGGKTETGSTIGEALKGETVITAICEINGCFGHIGRDGRFHYIYLPQYIQGLYPSNDLFPADDLFPMDPQSERIGKGQYIECTYKDYTTKPISRLQICMKEGDIGADVGDGDNCYVIEDNFLVYGKSTEELRIIGQNILSKIRGVTYMPFTCEASGNPCLEVGDPIRLCTKYDIVESYILQRTLKGIQVLRDSYSAEGVSEYPKTDNSTKAEIRKLKGKSNYLERTIEETRLEMEDIEEGLNNRISITAAGLDAEITRASAAEGSLSTMVSAVAGEVSLKVSKDNIIGEINASPEALVINFQRIDLNGLVNAQELVSRYATITNLNVTNLKVQNLELDHVSVSELNAVSSRIGSLEADHVTTAELNATNAAISGKLSATDLQSVNVTAQNLIVKAANISGTLTADKINVESLSGIFATYSGFVEIQNLSVVSHAGVTDLSVGSGYVRNLSATSANVDNLSVGSVSALWKTITVGKDSYTVLAQ